MGLTYVTVSLRVPGSRDGHYEAPFLVDTSATDSMAPASRLIDAGIQPIGRTSYPPLLASSHPASYGETGELADGSVYEFPFGLAQIEFLGEITAGRVIFGPENVEPILGVTALESVGMTIDPASRTPNRLPAIPLK